MGSRFYFGGSDDSGSDAGDNESSLPFPKPIDRNAFLAEDFDPARFLSTLSDRFQTLEDLQNELRELSQSLNKELIDLVNDNYNDFLSLGTSLQGGEERVEEIRVGLLGSQRDLVLIKGKIETRRNELVKLMNEKRQIRQQIRTGRELLEVAERLELLEHGMPNRNGQSNDSAVTDDSDYDSDWEGNETGSGREIPSLKRKVDQYRLLKELIKTHDTKHPFLVGQQEPMVEIQSELLRAADIALRAAINSTERQDAHALKQVIVQNYP